MVALFIVFAIVMFLTIDFAVQRAAHRKAAARSGAAASEVLAHAPAPRPSPLPAGVFVHPGHTWLALGTDGSASLGLSGLSAAVIGRPDALHLHAPGTEVLTGEPIMTLHHKGRSIALRSPVDATIEDINLDLADNPAELFDKPFEHSWVYRLRPRDVARALPIMKVGEDAARTTRESLSSLRDRVVELVGVESPVGATMLDGGLPAAPVVELLDDAAWTQLVDELFGAASASPTATVIERRA